MYTAKTSTATWKTQFQITFNVNPNISGKIFLLHYYRMLRVISCRRNVSYERFIDRLHYQIRFMQ
jgi:hypothetical protein